MATSSHRALAVFAFLRVAGLCEAGAESARDAAANPHAEPRLFVVWFDPLNALSGSGALVAREVASLFGALGVDVAWRAAEPGALTSPPEIQVIVLDGATARAPAPRAMGAVLHREPAGRHALWVHLPNVKRALGLDPVPGRRSSPLQEAQLARAVARVVAHEVVHLLAPGLPHAETGLMRARLDRAALLGAHPEVDATARRAVLTRLGGLARAASPVRRRESSREAG